MKGALGFYAHRSGAWVSPHLEHTSSCWRASVPFCLQLHTRSFLRSCWCNLIPWQIMSCVKASTDLLSRHMMLLHFVSQAVRACEFRNHLRFAHWGVFAFPSGWWPAVHETVAAALSRSLRDLSVQRPVISLSEASNSRRCWKIGLHLRFRQLNKQDTSSVLGEHCSFRGCGLWPLLTWLCPWGLGSQTTGQLILHDARCLALHSGATVQ